jgi:HpcH/HpaI aldolase/citrate lyase family
VAAATGHSRDSVQLRRLTPLPVGELVLTLWTSDPELAARADAAGVERIGVDLERLGKAERQKGLGTWISQHTEEDLAAVGSALSSASLFARVDPPHDGTSAQVDRVLAAGAEVVMLPMFRTAAEVERFVALVDERARVVLLLETPEAVDAVEEIAAVEGVDEIHLGLNDLTLALGLPNRFMLLASDLAARLAGAVTGAGLRFGAGGIGRAGDVTLPITADLVYAQYARLGAGAALVSRSFLRRDAGPVDMGREVERARARMAEWRARGPEELEAARLELTERAAACARW